MLGNFSFGDYFKEKACKMAWELSTKVYQIPAERIWVSVFEQDDDTFAIWRDVVGVPAERIRRMGEADNFWAAGPTGPCGPCTELYYDYHPDQGTAPEVTLEDDERFVEFYNLVFMEDCRQSDGSLTPLERKCIDTGLGLERMAQILQRVENNYETDLLMPILDKAASLAPDIGNYSKCSDEKTKTALKVIGDHIRAVTYLISDGVLPSNVGRGYVVRRLVRRVVMKGRLVGIKKPFTAEVAAVAVALSVGCDGGVAGNAGRIYEELGREEGKFLDTLDAGEKVLRQVFDQVKQGNYKGGNNVVSGENAFLLYDTFGFPLEVTMEAAEEAGLTVDVASFEACMAGQRKRSKDAAKDVDVTADNAIANLIGSSNNSGGTTFVGYSELIAQEATVVGLFKDGQLVEQVEAGSYVDVLLDTTPFYAESGGQIGDVGILSNSSSSSSAMLLVSDVKKAAGGAAHVHKAEVQSGTIKLGDILQASVDRDMRRRARCNHTATHLLQAALKQVLGEATSQQGSLVEFDRLRFDFNLPRGMTEDEVSQVEKKINQWIQEAHTVSTAVMKLSEAKSAGAVAMFGEKYGDEVRVVDVPGVSMELCGGTHVGNTSEICGFKILMESGIASGVRRIEAVAGPALIDHVNGLDSVVKGLVNRFKCRPEQLGERVATLTEELKSTQKALVEVNSQLALAKSASMAGDAETLPSGVKVLVKRMEGVDGKSLQEAAKSLQEALGDSAAVVLGSAAASLDGGSSKVFLAVAFSPAVVKEGGMQAGKFVGGVAKVCGGGGGGKANLAQAGGKDASKLDEALEMALRDLKVAL